MKRFLHLGLAAMLVLSAMAITGCTPEDQEDTVITPYYSFESVDDVYEIMERATISTMMENHDSLYVTQSVEYENSGKESVTAEFLKQEDGGFAVHETMQDEEGLQSELLTYFGGDKDRLSYSISEYQGNALEIRTEDMQNEFTEQNWMSISDDSTVELGEQSLTVDTQSIWLTITGEDGTVTEAQYTVSLETGELVKGYEEVSSSDGNYTILFTIDYDCVIYIDETNLESLYTGEDVHQLTLIINHEDNTTDVIKADVADDVGVVLDEEGFTAFTDSDMTEQYQQPVTSLPSYLGRFSDDTVLYVEAM